jgi:hypothetical protein
MILPPPHILQTTRERYHRLFLDLFTYWGLIVVFIVMINYEVVSNLSKV